MLLEGVRKICNDSSGKIRFVTPEIYAKYLTLALDVFLKFEIKLTLIAYNTTYQEKAALVSLIGLLNSIDEQIIKKSESALLAVTGGFGEKQVSIYNPNIIIDDVKNLNLSDLRLSLW